MFPCLPTSVTSRLLRNRWRLVFFEDAVLKSGPFLRMCSPWHPIQLSLHVQVLKPPFGARQQRAPLCTKADLEFRPDVDWWAGGASDGYETWRDLARHGRTSNRAPNGRPSEKVTAPSGRRSRMLLNPFQGIREPPACLNAMLENRFGASTMTRVAGVHTLQKAIRSSRHHTAPTPEDITVVSRWLSPLLDREPSASGKAKLSAAGAALSQSRDAAVGHLRARGAVLLLHSLAKLKQTRGWGKVVEDRYVQAILNLLLQRMEHLTATLDGQAISNSLYALAVLECRIGPLIAGLTVAVDNAAAHMDAQQLSNVLWALARLDVALPDTLLAVTSELSTRQANAQDIANCIWALAHLECTPRERIQGPLGKLVVRMLQPRPAVGDERMSRGHISSFSPRHHINVLWGLSRLGLHSTTLNDTSAALLMPQMAAAGDQGLAMLAATFGGGCPLSRHHSHLALPLLCAVANTAHTRVLQGRIIPDALAQCIWHLWMAAAAPAGALGCTQQLTNADQKACHARLLAAASRGQPIRVEKPHSITETGKEGSVHSMLAMQRAHGAVPAQLQAPAVSATPRVLHDCVRALVSALSIIQPQVADRLLRCMQPRQLVQVLIVASEAVSREKDSVLLERFALPLRSALDKMKPTELAALCHVMSRGPQNGTPSYHELARAVALHMWSGNSGVSMKQREELLRLLRRKVCSLPIQVHKRT